MLGLVLPERDKGEAEGDGGQVRIWLLSVGLTVRLVLMQLLMLVLVLA